MMRVKTKSQGLIDRYRAFLPVTSKTPVVTFCEGNTPLLHSEKLSKLTGTKVYLKCEGHNPTGSFKDRGMTVAVSKAKEKGAKAVLCASTGNTSASAAAYAARAGIDCFVILPKGSVALGKLSQAMICKARVIPIDGNFDDALRLAREITNTENIELVNSVNPNRIEGQKTGAFEICDDLNGRAPDIHIIPVGNAGNISAYWKGYTDYFRSRMIKNLPQMMGFQAKGAAPFVMGKPISNPKTFATAIRIGNPASWIAAEKATYESKGCIDAVTDAEILKAYLWLAREEGLFVEPASAASIAGLFKLSRSKLFKERVKKSRQKLTIACVLTGHGLKDPKTALKSIRVPKPVPATTSRVLREIKK